MALEVGWILEIDMQRKIRIECSTWNTSSTLHTASPKKRSVPRGTLSNSMKCVGVFHVEHSIQLHQTKALLSQTRSNYSATNIC
jgi:hypothetical protein